MCTSAHKRWWFQTYITISIYGLIVSGKYLIKKNILSQTIDFEAKVM